MGSLVMFVNVLSPWSLLQTFVYLVIGVIFKGDLYYLFLVKLKFNSILL